MKTYIIPELSVINFGDADILTVSITYGNAPVFEWDAIDEVEL